jgi:hypothetical protein
MASMVVMAYFFAVISANKKAAPVPIKNKMPKVGME